jgi:hypothetical protein
MTAQRDYYKRRKQNSQTADSVGKKKKYLFVTLIIKLLAPEIDI